MVTPFTGAGTLDSNHSWTFLSNYAHVLVCLAEDPSARLRDVAARVGAPKEEIKSMAGAFEHEDLEKARSL